MNSLFLGQFKLVNLFAYQVHHSKKFEKLGHQLAILLGFKMLTIQLNFVT